MRATTLLLVFSLAAAASAGCVENMRDLKDKMSAEQPAAQELDSSALANTTNATKIFRAPVARVGIFGANGALVYQATFIAANETDPVFVAPKSNVTLTAAASESLEPGATLTKFAWTVAGKPHTGRQVSVEMGEPGLYPVTLTITDSNGMVDEHAVAMAVAPEPFTVESTMTTGPVAGANGEGVAAEFTFDATDTVEDKLHKIVAIQFETDGGAGCDSILTIEAPDGSKIGPQDSGSDETISFANAPAGAYKGTLAGFACAAPTGVPVHVVVTYLLVVPGLGDDAHGGHAGH